MSFFYESQGTNKYLVYKFEEKEKIDSLSLCMLTNNRIDGFVPLFYTQADSCKLIKYNISAKVSLSKFLDDRINKKTMLRILSDMVCSLINAKEYMLEEAAILLNEDYIFVDVSECKAWMIYLPLSKSAEREENIETFFKKIVFGACYDQNENVDYITELIAYLNRRQGFLLDEFKELIERLINSDAMNFEVQVPGCKSIITEITNSTDESLSNVVFDTDMLCVNDNSEDSWQITSKTIKPQWKNRMTLGYLITHYSRENRYKFMEQYKKPKDINIRKKVTIDQVKDDYVMRSHLLTPAGSKN